MTPSILGEIRPEFSKLSILRTLWKGRFLLIPVWLFITVASGLYIRRMPSYYAADALILVQPPSIAEKYVSPSVNAEVIDRLATVKQEALSNEHLQEIIDDLHLYPSERNSVPNAVLCERIRTQSWISPDKNWVGNHTMQLHAGFQGTDPKTTAAVANRLAKLFIQEEFKNRASRSEGTSEFIGDRLTEAKNKLDTLEAALSDYKLKHHGALPQQENTLLAAVAGLQSELQSSEAAISRARQSKAIGESTLAVADTTLKLLEQGSKSADTSAVVEAAKTLPDLPHPAEKDVRRSVSIQAQLEQLQMRYGDEHPEIRRLKAELISARRLERDEDSRAGASAAPSVASGPGPTTADIPRFASYAGDSSRHLVEIGRARERVATLGTQVESAEAEIAKQTENRDRVARELEACQTRISMLPVREQEIAKLLRDYEISKTNYTSLLNKKLSAEMATDLERHKESEEFTIIGAARPPSTPVKPNRPMLLAVSSASGLFLALAMVIGLEFHRGTLLGEWEMPAGTVILARLPVVQISLSSEDDSHSKSGLKRQLKRQAAVLVSNGTLLLAVITGILLVGHSV